MCKEEMDFRAGGGSEVEIVWRSEGTKGRQCGSLRKLRWAKRRDELVTIRSDYRCVTLDVWHLSLSIYKADGEADSGYLARRHWPGVC